jgi:hypothetical protein
MKVMAEGKKGKRGSDCGLRIADCGLMDAREI